MNQSYPGRACMAPLLDLLMTLLHLGAAGWRDALRAREDVYPYLRDRLRDVAAEHGAALRAGCECRSTRRADVCARRRRARAGHA